MNFAEPFRPFPGKASPFSLGNPSFQGAHKLMFMAVHVIADQADPDEVFITNALAFLMSERFSSVNGQGLKLEQSPRLNAPSS
jgi:hypothetical protein